MVSGVVVAACPAIEIASKVIAMMSLNSTFLSERCASHRSRVLFLHERCPSLEIEHTGRMSSAILIARTGMAHTAVFILDNRVSGVTPNEAKFHASPIIMQYQHDMTWIKYPNAGDVTRQVQSVSVVEHPSVN